MERVLLWWLGEGGPDDGLLEHARKVVESALDVSARRLLDERRPDGTYDDKRKQHASQRFLRFLLDARPADCDKVLGVTDVDLFVPILTFVYGEAQLGGAVAVVSTARLSAGDLFPDRRKVAARLGKECVHELGHAFGLVHCNELGCAMNRSVNVVAIDAKKPALCQSCRTLLAEHRRKGSQGS